MHAGEKIGYGVEFVYAGLVLKSSAEYQAPFRFFRSSVIGLGLGLKV